MNEFKYVLKLQWARLFAAGAGTVLWYLLCVIDDAFSF
jgi:hypothetical protein